MKYTILKLAVLVGMIGFSGCTDFMDTTPTDRVSDKMIWQDEASANLYLNTFYAYIDRYGVFGNAQFNSNLTEGLTNTFKYRLLARLCRVWAFTRLYYTRRTGAQLTNPPAKGRSILRTLTPQVCPLNQGRSAAFNSPLQEESIYYKLIRVIFPKA